MIHSSGAPLFDELCRYAEQPLIPFHTPGHKAGLGLGEEWARPGLLTRLDLTEIPSMAWEKTLEEAETLAAAFFRADRSFFLTQGATQGILAMLIGALTPGDTVLVARNCHCSVINGLILAGLTPVFLEVEYLPGWEVPVGVSPSSLEKGLKEHPNAKGFIMTNPTYQGIAARLGTYRDIVGERLFIVDEAHGGHFRWMDYSGFDAVDCADLWVQGTHKILGSLTQTGLLHTRKGRVDLDRIQKALKIVSTTSPSYVLLASLDYNRNWLLEQGRHLFRENLPQVQSLKSRLAGLPGLEMIGPSSGESVFGAELAFDPWKVCLSFRNFGLTGYQADMIYRKEWGIQSEYADRDQVTFFIAPWQEKDDLAALFKATQSVCLKRGLPLGRTAPRGRLPLPETVLSPRDAALGLMEEIPVSQAKGRIAAGIVAPYPPGIPLLVPGERIRDGDLDYIVKILQCGGTVHGVRSGKIFVVK